MLRYFANGRVRWKSGMRCNTRTNWEFYAVIAGRAGAIRHDGEAATLQTHRLWIFAPECSHAWVDDGQRSYHRLCFHFGSVPYPLDEFVRNRGGVIERPLGSTEIEELRRIAGQVEPHFCRPTRMSSLHFQHALAALSLLALQDETFAEADLTLTDSAQFKVERALSWYAEHLSRHPSVKEVAEAIHVSSSHLRRLFRQVRRSSPKSLFRSVRLDRAKDLMSRTTLTLEDVARECGYSSASHLCRECKSAHRFTPTTWRRRLVDRFEHPLPTGTIPLREYSARAQERAMRA